MSRIWKLLKQKYTSKAYRAYLEARRPPLHLVLALNLHAHMNREGFARRYLRLVNNEPPPTPRPKSQMLIDFEALPECKPYSFRVRNYPVEPEVLAFLAKYAQPKPVIDPVRQSLLEDIFNFK